MSGRKTTSARLENAAGAGARSLGHSEASPVDSTAFVKGQRLTMQSGPFRGLAGTLVEMLDRPRLILSLRLRRTSVLIEIEREWVIPSKTVKRSDR